MDIFEHIMKEHQEVNQMLSQLSGGASGKQQVFDKLKLSVAAHVQAEEESIYLALGDTCHNFIAKAIEEHREVSKLIEVIDKAGISDDAFSERIDTLTEMIQRHVQKEESQMLSKAKEVLDQDQVQQLSQKFDEIDERIMQKAR